MANSQESYTMSRDSYASGRLTLQHWLLTNQFGLIHPTITKYWTNADSKSPRRVADIACGNAIWAMEVSESDVAKDLEVVGFDISSAQFPPRDNWPSNLTLRTGDMFKPPPKEYEGFFDLVNIKMVQITLKDGNPRPVIEYCLKLLKPGGFLQWIEVDMASPAVPADSVYCQIGPMVTRAGGPKSYTWMKEMGKIFQDMGFQEVEYASELPRKSIQKYFNDNYLMAITEMAKGLNSPDVDEWWTACQKETAEKGVVAIWPNVQCIGRKSI